jgi:hypothetical protein
MPAHLDRRDLLAGAAGVGAAGCLDTGEETTTQATDSATPAPTATPDRRAVTTAEEFASAIATDEPRLVVIDDAIDVSSVAPMRMRRFTTVTTSGGYRQYPLTNTSTDDTFQLGNSEHADVYIHFEGVTFTGDNTCPYHFGIADNNAMEISFRRCWFDGADIAGYLHKGQWRTHFFNCQFSGDWGSQDHAIVAEQHQETGNNQLRIADGNQIDGHGSHGVYIKGMGGFSMYGSTCEHNGGYCL